jgi:hypothetical protein
VLRMAELRRELGGSTPLGRVRSEGLSS